MAGFLKKAKVALLIALAQGVASKASAQQAALPSTNSLTRCYSGLVTENSPFACLGAKDEDGRDVPFGNSVTADRNAPYDVNISLQTDQRIVYYPPTPEEPTPTFNYEGANEAGAVGFTEFYAGFLLLKDLPEDFDYTKAFIPVEVRSSYFFRAGASRLKSDDPIATVNDGLTKERVQDYLNSVVPITDGADLLTERLLADGALQDEYRNIYYDEEGQSSLSNAVFGISDVRFFDVRQSEIYLKDGGLSYSDVARVTYSRNIFNKEGDFFAVKGEKGATCLVDTYKANASCDLFFDPVLSLDQKAFDAAMGDKTFNLSSYFKLTTSTGTSAVPEPSTWMMIVFGFGAIGYAMRRKTVLRYV